MTASRAKEDFDIPKEVLDVPSFLQGRVAKSQFGTEGQPVSIRRVEALRRTPLHAQHVALGARMVPFAGWEMPVQYDGVISEHRAVREDSGAFDVSHMGEIEIEGPTARELLQSLLSNDLDRLGPGRPSTPC